MNYLILFFSFLPIFLIGYYYYHKDTVKEPKSLLKNLFFSGILSAIIVIIISLITMIFIPNLSNTSNLNKLELFFYTFIFIAFIEEICKWFMIYKISYNSEYFDQYFDIVLYSVYVGLGFACFENLLYIASSNSALEIAIFRSITAVPAHACFQTYMGYFLGNNKFKNYNKKRNMTLSILIPTLLHGLYDYLLLMNNLLFLIIYIIFIIILFIITIIKIKNIVKLDKSYL